MKELKFFGRIIPEIREINIAKRTIKISESDDFSFDFEIFSSKGYLSLIVKSNIDLWQNRFRILSKIYDISSSIVDVIAFSKGVSLLVLIDSIEYNFVRIPVSLGETSVQKFCKKFENTEYFESVVTMCFDDINIRLAFRDLILSLNTLNYSSIAAARCLDAIRNIMCKHKNKEISWDYLRKNLRIDRSYLDLIASESRKSRHGIRDGIDGNSQLDITHKIWQIMIRFIEFKRLGGEVALPEDEFEFLV